MEPFLLVESMDICALNLSDSVKSYMTDSIATHSPIVVRIDATHSGIVTKNLTMYIPESMERSAHTWISDYQKPVLKHHDTLIDAIGRVVNAEYIRTSFKHNDSAADNTIPAGYIQLYAKITDPDAIQKILDGRFITVSIGCSASSVKCSICSTIISEVGLCEHIRGRKYGEEDSDKKLCYWVIGDVEYREVSFVNTPADKHAKVTGIQQATAVGLDKKDNKDSKDNQESVTLEILTDTTGLQIEFEDDKKSKEENQMRKDLEKLDDSVFCLVKTDGDNKVRIYPADTVDNLVDSIKTLAADETITDEEKKAVYDAFIEKSKCFGIKIEDWDAQSKDEIKWQHITLSDATAEQILALPVAADFVRKSEVPNPVENADEALKAGFHALKDKLDAAEKDITALKAELEQKKSELVKAAEENTELHKKVHRDLAEKVVRMRVQMRKPDVIDVKTQEDLEAKISEFETREISSLKDALVDLEKEAPLFADLKQVVTPAGAADDKSFIDLIFEGSKARKSDTNKENPTVKDMLGIN